jgi:hypothetical protein
MSDLSCDSAVLRTGDEHVAGYRHMDLETRIGVVSNHFASEDEVIRIVGGGETLLEEHHCLLFQVETDCWNYNPPLSLVSVGY